MDKPRICTIICTIALVAIVLALYYAFGFPIPIISLILLLSSLASALFAIIIWQIRPYASLCSLILLVLSFILLAIPIIQPLTTSPLKVSGSETYRYILEYITAPVSVVTVLFDAFLVKPYFREVGITGNELRDNINIREVTVKDVEGKERSRISFCGSVIQCSLRLRSEHFAVPIYAKNATGWVALINKARNVELHAGYAPWGYSHHYVLDIVGEESLILFFIPCPDKECRKYAYQLKDNLRASRGQIRLIFPVRPADIRRYGGSFIHLPTQYPFICPVFPRITIADVREFENWDQGLATEFEICINALDHLHLRVRAGGENTTIYEYEFKLRKVITSCIDDYLRRN